jgi:hypothetical protein
VNPAELARSLQEARGFGWVTCDWRPRMREGVSAWGHADIDEYLRVVFGNEAIHKNGYRELSATGARDAVSSWMQLSLAYRSSDVSGAPAGAAEPFFQVFSTSVRFFTNSNELGNQFSSKTLHTFDVGIVAIDATNIGLLWFAEED